jgi:parallel beta-helix repeat protein
MIPDLRQQFFLLLGLAVTSIGSAWAATYYVAPPPGGSDANPGTFSSPWATLQKAADTIQAGDTVLVRAGQYAGGHFTTSGLPGSPIVLQAYGDEIVEITADNPVTPDGINLEGASWMVVEGFAIEGRGRAGIRAVLCEHVTLRDNRLEANQKWGIFTGFCDDLVLDGNQCSNSIVEHGIYVSNSGDRPTVRRNTIWGNHANGIHMNGDVSQGGDGVISGALIAENKIFGNGVGGGSGINLDGVQDSIIRNNLIFDTHASGISLYQIDGGEPSTGNQVLHNTVIVASDGRWALNVSDGSTGNTVLNNVFYSYHGYRGGVSIDSDSLPGSSSDHNAVEDRFTVDGGDTVMTLAEWQVLTGEDFSSLTASPEELFVAPELGDFELDEGSPAVDAGEMVSEVPTDRLGRPRPIGPGFDIGAHEGVGILFADGFEMDGADRWTDIQP